jgi:hypothetical protein
MQPEPAGLTSPKRWSCRPHIPAGSVEALARQIDVVQKIFLELGSIGPEYGNPLDQNVGVRGTIISVIEL